jgi:hypothetical protein
MEPRLIWDMIGPLAGIFIATKIDGFLISNEIL